MLFRSPPSREAWIEISDMATSFLIAESPPSREAWIEMYLLLTKVLPVPVASLTGGVD